MLGAATVYDWAAAVNWGETDVIMSLSDVICFNPIHCCRFGSFPSLNFLIKIFSTINKMLRKVLFTASSAPQWTCRDDL